MDQLSKQDIKTINRYHLKKYRKEDGLFLAEGSKIISELLNSPIRIRQIIHTPSYQNKYTKASWDNIAIKICTEKDFQKISSQKSPEGILAICEIPEQSEINYDEWILVLDDINNPGNLGTMIRTADWFGLHQIVCSEHTVDVYNEKVIQSSMGSIARVKVHYLPIANFITNAPLPCFGAFLEGESMYSFSFPNQGILLIGNESHGINPELAKLVSQKITIPRKGEAESLNAAVATGIILSQICK